MASGHFSGIYPVDGVTSEAVWGASPLARRQDTPKLYNLGTLACWRRRQGDIPAVRGVPAQCPPHDSAGSWQRLGPAGLTIICAAGTTPGALNAPEDDI